MAAHEYFLALQPIILLLTFIYIKDPVKKNTEVFSFDLLQPWIIVFFNKLLANMRIRNSSRSSLYSFRPLASQYK